MEDLVPWTEPPTFVANQCVCPSRGPFVLSWVPETALIPKTALLPETDLFPETSLLPDIYRTFEHFLIWSRLFFNTVFINKRHVRTWGSVNSNIVCNVTPNNFKGGPLEK